MSIELLHTFGFGLLYPSWEKLNSKYKLKGSNTNPDIFHLKERLYISESGYTYSLANW